MNNSENDDYWNESKVSTFNFERDEKNADLGLFEYANSTSFKKGTDSELFAHSYSAQNIGSEAVRNFLPENYKQWILRDESEHRDLNTFSNIRPDEEVRLLRRQMKERWIPPNQEDTINRILYGQPYSFELYRSLSSKKSLLTSAIESADGDAILAVTVFLARTLKKSLFRQLIMDHPIVISHYVHYLYTRRQMTELSDILEALGRPKEAMMKQLTVACQNPNKIQQRLTLLLKNYSVDSWERQMVENYSKLIEWQIAASKQENDPSIVGRTAHEFIKYYHLCNLSTSIGNIPKVESQPESYAKLLKFSNKQLSMVKIHAHCEEKKWDVVRNLLVTKSWVGAVRLNTELPIERILDQLQKYGAPSILLDEILSCITDTDRKVEIARKLDRHAVVIETYSKKRDRNNLLQYMALLEPQSVDWLNAQKCLDTMDSKHS